MNKPTAYVIWHGIEEQFRDNELHRAVYLEAEFCNLVQGDMDIARYTDRLKQLAIPFATSANPSARPARCSTFSAGSAPSTATPFR